MIASSSSLGKHDQRGGISLGILLGDISLGSINDAARSTSAFAGNERLDYRLEYQGWNELSP